MGLHSGKRCDTDAHVSRDLIISDRNSCS